MGDFRIAGLGLQNCDSCSFLNPKSYTLNPRQSVPRSVCYRGFHSQNRMLGSVCNNGTIRRKHKELTNSMASGSASVEHSRTNDKEPQVMKKSLKYELFRLTCQHRSSSPVALWMSRLTSPEYHSLGFRGLVM